MDIRLLKIFRRRASKEICLRRQPGNRYQIVCPIDERDIAWEYSSVNGYLLVQRKLL
nr:MAG TPA: hypothetical protein [Herelleviridae sp.]